MCTYFIINRSIHVHCVPKPLFKPPALPASLTKRRLRVTKDVACVSITQLKQLPTQEHTPMQPALCAHRQYQNRQSKLSSSYTHRGPHAYLDILHVPTCPAGPFTTPRAITHHLSQKPSPSSLLTVTRTIRWLSTC